MKFLIDTHIWIWLADNPRRIGRKASRQLASPRNEILLSSVSVWEFITLARKGRFSKIRDPFPWLGRALTGWPLQEVGLSWEIAQEAGRIACRKATQPTTSSWRRPECWHAGS